MLDDAAESLAESPNIFWHIVAHWSPRLAVLKATGFWPDDESELSGEVVGNALPFVSEKEYIIGGISWNRSQIEEVMGCGCFDWLPREFLD